MAFYFPASVDKRVRMLCRCDGIHHNGNIPCCRIFHTNRNVKTTGSQTVLLVFYRSCTNCNISEKVRKVAMVFRIQHFVCTGKAGFADGTDMKVADRDQTLQHIRFFCGVRLMEHTFVPIAGRSRLVGVNAGDDVNFIGYFVLYGSQARNIVDDTVVMIGRTRTDNQNESVVSALKNRFDFFIALCFDCCELICQRVLSLDVLGNG